MSIDSDDCLVADKNDPHLSVHELSEFVYCPRAGLCLYEQEYEEEEPHEEANLFHIPMHEPDELAILLESLMRQFMWIIVCGLGSFIVLLVAAWWFGGLWLWGTAAVALVLTTWGLINRGVWVYLTKQRLDMWQDARRQMPDADSPKIQDVDWRDLIASGATVITQPAPYSNPTWRLGGKPSRILEYGDLQIPVFHYCGKWRDLFPQHLVRMTAYCRLIETEVGARSPYGVIIKGRETFAAVTVPNTVRTRDMLRAALPEARQTVRDAEEVNKYPPKPSHESLCEGCHLARRRRLRWWRRFLRHGTAIDPLPERGRDGKLYHSHCGDRFSWTPPLYKKRN